MTTEKLIKSIMAELPQIVFVTEQVSAAIEIAKEELDADKFESTLRLALKMAQFSKETSEPQYPKFHLIVIALLKDVPNITTLSGFKTFETMSNIIGRGIEDLSLTAEESERGFFKGTGLKLARLYNSDVELFLLEVLSIKEEIIRAEEEHDTATILGYAYAELNLRNSNLPLLSNVQKYYGELMILTESISF